MRRRITFLIFIQTVMIMATAQAVIISDHDEHVKEVTDWFDILTVDKFDPALGTLNSVTVKLMAEMMSDLTLDNDNQNKVTVIGDANVTLTGGPFPGLGVFVLEPEVATGFIDLEADDSGDTDLPGDGGLDEAVAIGVPGTAETSVTILPGDAEFGTFLGPGTLSTDIVTLSGFGVTGGSGNIQITVNTEAGAELWVEYDYTQQGPGGGQIPEPSAFAVWWLLSLAFAGARLWRRRHE